MSLKAFLQQIESAFPGATKVEYGEADVARLPSVLKKWREPNGWVSKFSYDFESNGKRLFGGIEFGDPGVLLADKNEWAHETWVAGDEGQLELWKPAVPFAMMANGDFLAFAHATKDDAPVIYLSHDDESRVIAPSFERFILEWSKVGYIGPEEWMLDPFIDPQSGFLKAAVDEGSEAAEILSVFAQAGIDLGGEESGA